MEHYKVGLGERDGGMKGGCDQDPAYDAEHAEGIVVVVGLHGMRKYCELAQILCSLAAGCALYILAAHYGLGLRPCVPMRSPKGLGSSHRWV
jgi:hypothetical protein